MLEFGFAPVSYDPGKRELRPLKSRGPGSTLYVRSLDEVADRLEKSEAVEVLGRVY